MRSHPCRALVVLGLLAGCANPSNETASIADANTAAPPAVYTQGEKTGPSKGQANHDRRVDIVNQTGRTQGEKTGPSKGQVNYDRRMDIVNQTGRTINHFYATNSSVKKWGRDLLGQDVILPGRVHRFDFNDGTDHCTFDFRAVFDNGRPIERYNVNVCRAEAWVLRQRDIDAPSPAQPGVPGPKAAPKREIGA